MSSFVTLLTGTTPSAADAPVPLMNDAQGTDQAAASVAAAFGAALVTASQKLRTEGEPNHDASPAPVAEGDAAADADVPDAWMPVDIQTPPSVAVTLEHVLSRRSAQMLETTPATQGAEDGAPSPDASASPDVAVASARGRVEADATADTSDTPVDLVLASGEKAPDIERAAPLARPSPAEGPTPAELVAQFVARAAARGQATLAAAPPQRASATSQAADAPALPQPEENMAEGAVRPDAVHGQAIALAGLQAPPESAAVAPPDDAPLNDESSERATKPQGHQEVGPQADGDVEGPRVQARDERASEGWAQATAVAAPGPQPAAPEPDVDARSEGTDFVQTPRGAPGMAQAPLTRNEPMAPPVRDFNERAADEPPQALGSAERTAPEAAESDQEALAERAAAPEAPSFHAALNHAQAPDAPVATASPVAQPIQVAQVSQELGAVISQGARRVQLRVSPEGMGELDVQIRMHRGEVHLTIRGDAPELAQALSQQVQGLRQDLDQQGLTLGTMDFGSLTSHTPSHEGDGRRGFDAEGQRSSHEDAGLRRLVGEGSVRIRPAPSPAGRALSTRVIDVVL